MGEVVKALRDNADLINNLFGSIENVVVSKNYDTVLKEIADVDKEHQDYSKYQEVMNRIKNVDWQDADNYTPEKTIDFDKVKDSSAYKEYEKYFQDFNTPMDPVSTEGDGASKPVLQTFEEFMNANPAYKDEIDKGYMKQTLKNSDQIKADYYKKAGLSDEEVDFYSKYKPPYAEGHNQKLLGLFQKYYPNLQGDYIGDKYSSMFKNKLESLQLPVDKEIKYKTHYNDETGEMLIWDENNPEDITTKKVGKEKVKAPPGINSKNVEIDAEGNAYYYGDVFNPETGMFEQKKLRNLSPQELKEFQDSQDKMNKTGVYSKTGKGGKKGGLGKGKGFNPNSLKLDELKALTPDKLSGMNISQLKSLKENKKYLSEETRTKLDSLLKRSDDDTESDSTDTNDPTYDANYDLNKETESIDDTSNDEEVDVAVDETTLTADLTTRIRDIQAAVDNNEMDEAKSLKDEMYYALGQILDSYPKELMDKLYDYANRYVNSVNL